MSCWLPPKRSSCRSAVRPSELGAARLRLIRRAVDGPGSGGPLITPPREESGTLTMLNGRAVQMCVKWLLRLNSNKHQEEFVDGNVKMRGFGKRS